MINRMVLQNLLHRPVRTAVSVLAVAIEVGMVMLVVGLSTGMLNESAKRVEGVGADILVQPPGASMFFGLTQSPMPIKIADRLAEIPRVAAVAPVLFQFNSSGGGIGLIYGIDIKSFDLVSGGFVYHAGGPFEQPYDIMVDDWYAKANKVKVGQTLHFLNHDFRVSGIVEHGKGARLFIPLETAQDLTVAQGRASIFFVKLTNPGYADDAKVAISTLLPGYQVLPMREYMSMMSSNNLPALRVFISVLISVAVTIGFLVIFLSMYTTITERTREIGILKSLGASKGYILQAILREASLLAVLGIIAGLLGTLAAKKLIIASFPTQAVDLTVEWGLYSTILALTGTLIGAFYPALRAARLDPVDALGYE